MQHLDEVVKSLAEQEKNLMKKVGDIEKCVGGKGELMKALVEELANQFELKAMINEVVAAAATSRAVAVAKVRAAYDPGVGMTSEACDASYLLAIANSMADYEAKNFLRSRRVADDLTTLADPAAAQSIQRAWRTWRTWRAERVGRRPAPTQ